MKYKDWLNEWLTLYVKSITKERTYNKYLRQTQKHIIPNLDDYELYELTTHILQKFAVELLDKGLATNTVNGIITIIKSSLKRAVLLDVAQQDYSNGITRPKIQEKRIECFTLQEQRK